MAFKRSSVRSRYPPLSKALRSKELRKALLLRICDENRSAIHLRYGEKPADRGTAETSVDRRNQRKCRVPRRPVDCHVPLARNRPSILTLPGPSGRRVVEADRPCNRVLRGPRRVGGDVHDRGWNRGRTGVGKRLRHGVQGAGHGPTRRHAADLVIDRPRSNCGAVCRGRRGPFPRPCGLRCRSSPARACRGPSPRRSPWCRRSTPES